MSGNAWQVCRDGLKPLIQAVSRLEEPDIGKLVEWFRAGAHPFSGLHDDLINVSLKTWLFAGTRTQTSSRREMVRQWLQSNGYEADAREFDTRLRNLIDHLKKWELTATHEADRRKSIWKAKDEAGEFLELLFIIDESGCEALNDVAGEASETRNYLWQLDRSIQDKLGKQDLVTKFQEKLDTIDESLDLLKAGDTPRRPETTAESVKPTPDVGHSIDFRSVRWFGTLYSFTLNQAPVVRLLYEHWQAGTPDIGYETLLLAVDSEAPPARLSILFRDHPAWGTMIVEGRGKGTRRLSKPEA